MNHEHADSGIPDDSFRWETALAAAPGSVSEIIEAMTKWFAVTVGEKSAGAGPIGQASRDGHAAQFQLG